MEYVRIIPGHVCHPATGEGNIVQSGAYDALCSRCERWFVSETMTIEAWKQERKDHGDPPPPDYDMTGFSQ